jgi:glutamyl-tRNA reductase
MGRLDRCTSHVPEQGRAGCVYHRFLEQGGVVAAPFGVIGLSHHTAPREVRSRVGVAPDALPGMLDTARSIGIRECVILSTCNRTEIYYSGTDAETVRSLLARHAGVTVEELALHLYEKACVCAACHLFRVTSGLDSAVLGESEIVAQVKEAWRVAASCGMTGPNIDLLFQRGLEASKRIRTETELCRNVTSTGTLAVRAAQKRVGGFDRAEVVVLGAGAIGERVVRELRSAGATRVTVLNRTESRAAALADRWGFESGPLAGLEDRLTMADVVFATVGAATPILPTELLARVSADRDTRRLTIVDLGVPANAEPGSGIAGIEILDLDRLLVESSENSERRRGAVPAALVILDEELARFGTALTERAAAPTIRALLERSDEIRERNVEWAKSRLGHLGEREIRVVEEMARRMMIGILEAPIEGLKTEFAAQKHRDVVERLFDLNGGSTNS